MKNLTLQIKTVVLLQPTPNMIAKNMSASYQVGVVGVFPRTDENGIGKQAVISIPEKTMAIALQNNAMIDSMDLDQAVIYLATNKIWRQNLMGGTISGVDFQKKGDKYNLTARSKEIEKGTGAVGDEREVKENMFIVDYDSLNFMANIAMIEIDRVAAARIDAEKSVKGMFSGLFGGGNATPEFDNIEDAEEVVEDHTVAWGTTLETMIAYAEETGILEQLKKTQLTAAGALRSGKSLESVAAAIEALS